MFSKLRRAKSDSERPQASSQLRGMPALKQERMNRRSGMMSPTSHQVAKHTGLSDFDRTGVPSTTAEMKFIGNKPDLLLNTNVSNHNGVRNEIKWRENGSRFPSEHEGKIANSLGNGKAGVKESKARSDNGNTNVGPKDDANLSKTKKDKNKGRGLHSIKKQRKARRESDVTTSMRALTPRERESILFLEETLKNLNCGVEDDQDEFAVTDQQEEETESSSDSDTSSVGSIIDLVGNLSDSYSPTLASAKSTNKKVMANFSVPCNNSDASLMQNNGCVRSTYVSQQIYAKVEGAKGPPLNRYQEQSGIYQEVGPLVRRSNSSNNNNKTSVDILTRDQIAAIPNLAPPEEYRNEPSTTKKCPAETKAIITEPVYSVVNKTKKSAKVCTSLRKEEENRNAETRNYSFPAVPEAEPKDADVTAKNSRKFWNKLENSQEQPELSPSASSLSPSASSLVLPPLEDTSLGTSRLSTLPDIDEALQSQPRRFVIVPIKGKTPPAVAPRKHSTKLKRHQSERTHAEHLKLTTSNFTPKNHIDFDEKGNLISNTAMSMQGLDVNEDIKKDNSDKAMLVEPVVAIPRQTTLYSRSNSSSTSKPFIVTPANKRVLSWN